jgi:hypothetical protein
MIANLTWMAGVSYDIPMNPHLAILLGPCIRDLKSEGASGFSQYYIVGKKIPDLPTQQQGTESILVNSESLLFVDLW